VIRRSRHAAWLGLLIVALAVLAGVAVGRASAATLSVCLSGCKFATIQAAVDKAHAGDTIHIGKGTYAEQVIVGKSLTLSGIRALRSWFLLLALIRRRRAS
jgi:nitrous oxidase accessory protein NosD